MFNSSDWIEQDIPVSSAGYLQRISKERFNVTQQQKIGNLLKHATHQPGPGKHQAGVRGWVPTSFLLCWGFNNWYSLEIEVSDLEEEGNKDCIQEDFTLKSKWTMALEFSLHKTAWSSCIIWPNKKLMKLHFTQIDNREMFINRANVSGGYNWNDEVFWTNIVWSVKPIFRSSQFHFCEAWPCDISPISSVVSLMCAQKR